MFYSNIKFNILCSNITLCTTDATEMYLFIMIFNIIYLSNEWIIKKVVGQHWNTLYEVCKSANINVLL